MKLALYVLNFVFSGLACIWKPGLLVLLCAGCWVKPSAADQTQAANPRHQRFAGLEAEVLDQLTGRIWQRCSLGQKWDAKLGCVGVAKKVWFEEAKQLQSDIWRLPNPEELKSLFDAESMTIVDPLAFPDTPSTWYWAVGPDEGPVVWGVSCEEYEDSCFRGNAHAVRLVQRKTSILKLQR